MALINNLWVHVTGEDWGEQIQSTSHPVEKGLAITDLVRKQPRTLSISGLIVDAGGKSAASIVEKLGELMKTGSLITYNGVKTASDMQIQSFSCSHSNKVWGGCNFSMSLKEVRIAKKAYTPTASKTATTAKTSTTKTIKVGDVVVFKGGNVYISSDAKNPAVTRGRSTCKCTIINTASWSVHHYHLISTDGKMVYGWVNGADIEGYTNSAKTNVTTKSGTQQVSKGTGSGIYHTVKKGDTIWTLVNVNYKDSGATVQWVIDNNPSAFSRKGDARTLQVGARLTIVPPKSS